MKLGLLVNRIPTELADYSTTHLAMAATALGHEVWYMDTDDLAYDPDESIRARAQRTPEGATDDSAAFLSAVQRGETESQRIAIEDLDVLVLRNDPAEDFLERPWARSVGIIFGELAANRGVIVVNDPTGLSKALNKLYFQHFPPDIRPRTLVTRDPEEVRAFVASHDGRAVLKPLQGSGGHGVFMIRPEDAANLNQMIDAVARDGYIVVQEFLPAAEEGDVRIFLMNGRVMEHQGTYAAFRRVRTSSDFRSNITVGGQPAAAEVTDKMLEVAEAVRPKLVADGMFLVGLDIAGEKLIEVNVFSPAGFYSIHQLTGVNFATDVIDALEKKVRHLQTYSQPFTNAQIAML
ncbi:MAG: glutathione synthetase [Actinomycetota bacterium]|nr:glutathione synthetase [Actinomycetota bacterium]